MSKILVVDDDIDVRKSFQRLVPKHALLLAKSGRQARSLFKKHKTKIALIFMDGYLDRHDPEYDTINLTCTIRREGYTKPIVAMSRDSEMQKTQVSAGCTHRLHKYEHDKISALVEEALAK